MTNLDSGSAAGTAGATNPTDSNAQNAQQGSGTFTVTKEAWEGLVNSIQSLKSGAQSEKDRAVSGVNKRLDKFESDIRPLLERAHQLGTQNKSFDEALSSVQQEQSERDFRNAVMELSSRFNSGALPTSAGAGNTAGAGVDVGKVFAEYGLDLKDPFVAGKLGGKSFENSEQAELFAARILREKINTPPSDPAQQSANRSTPPISTNLDDLYSQYVDAFKEPSKNAELLETLEKQIKEAGG